MVLEGMLSPDDPRISASADWGEFRQQIFLTRSREAAKNAKNAKNAKEFFRAFHALRTRNLFGDDDQISSHSSRSSRSSHETHFSATQLRHRGADVAGTGDGRRYADNRNYSGIKPNRQ
jgi:hypothetical protein